MPKTRIEKKSFFSYKDKPLVRNVNTLYYGNMFEPYVVKLHIKTTEKIKNLDLATKVAVHLISTDSSLSLKDRVIKSAEKNSLYSAIDIADAWLEKALS